jgi:hypothetical protein
MGGTGTGPMMKGMGVWEVMQAYAGSEVAPGRGGSTLARMILGRLARVARVAPVRAGGKRTLRMSAAS